MATEHAPQSPSERPSKVVAGATENRGPACQRGKGAVQASQPTCSPVSSFPCCCSSVNTTRNDLTTPPRQPQSSQTPSLPPSRAQTTSRRFSNVTTSSLISIASSKKQRPVRIPRWREGKSRPPAPPASGARARWVYIRPTLIGARAARRSASRAALDGLSPSSGSRGGGRRRRSWDNRLRPARPRRSRRCRASAASGIGAIARPA
jgi:hypothetical protein